VSFPQAVLGAEIDVPTIDGKVKMKLPPGTQSGRIFRLRGKGLPVFGGAGKGDQLVKVLVEIPEKINRKQRKLIEELASELGIETHPQQSSFLAKLKALFE
jgi:molecular chaperone DnaJ